MAKIIFILFLVVILGLVIYAFNSGFIAKTISDAKNSLHFPALTGSSFTLAPPGNSNGSQTSVNGGYQISNPSTTAIIPGTTTTVNLSDIPVGFTVDQLSPYFHEVLFGGASPASGYSYGVITLDAYFNTSGTIDITGWHIASNRGGEYIPQAINEYDPSGLTAPTDIHLGSGDYVYIYSSSGPFNLRLNECIGYIGAENHLTPPLPSNCPYIDRSTITNFTGACQNYIESIGNCTVPDLNDPQIPQNDYACRQYIENNFNYRTCFEAHVSDPNFLSNEWWVWMGSSPIDIYHDNVYLYDRSGLLVDTYTY
jgi:hypothetical protein